MKNNTADNNDESIVKNEQALTEQETLNSVRGYIIAAQRQMYTAVNSTMVIAYWNIGKTIYEACGEMTVQDMEKNYCNFFPKNWKPNLGKAFLKEIFR